MAIASEPITPPKRPTVNPRLTDVLCVLSIMDMGETPLATKRAALAAYVGNTVCKASYSIRIRASFEWSEPSPTAVFTATIPADPPPSTSKSKVRALELITDFRCRSTRHSIEKSPLDLVLYRFRTAEARSRSHDADFPTGHRRSKCRGGEQRPALSQM